jgi:hypothetical protein
VLIAAPGIAPVADELAKSVGFKDMGGQQGLIDPAALAQQPQQPEQMPMDPAAGQVPPELQQADGAMVGMQQGIQTMAPDGVDPALQQ